MTSLRRRRLLKAACAGLCMPAASFADMRGKPLIRILLGLPHGGGTDAIARYFSDALSSLLEQPVIIENRVGVGGRLAADALKSAAPDGLTYMIAPNATPTFQTLVFGNQIKWDIWRDFEPVAGPVPSLRDGCRRTRAGNARDFARWAKANPGQATFGTPGLGGQNHSRPAVRQGSRHRPPSPLQGNAADDHRPARRTYRQRRHAARGPAQIPPCGPDPIARHL